MPLHVSDVRQHLKQDITDDDNLINLYLGSAVDFAQNLTQRQLVAARYRYVLDKFPSCGAAIRIPRTPLVQVVSIEYTATDGTTQTVPAADYAIDNSFDPPRITPVSGKAWPDTLCQIGSVRVTFDAGYSAPFTVDATANSLSVPAWKPMLVGEVVRLGNSGGVLPVPLAAKTNYYIQSVISPGVYTLSASSGGAVIDLTSAGTGLNFLGQPGINGSAGELPDSIRSWLLLRCDSLYTHKGEAANVRGELVPLPWVDGLLDPYRTALI
jgi:uncharacterized phiE125 gp8 family phage protein